LYPDAFTSKENLVKTLTHERTHAYQFQTFGPAVNSQIGGQFERAARGIEETW
jgi:hypothetical protein